MLDSFTNVECDETRRRQLKKTANLIGGELPQATMGHIRPPGCQHSVYPRCARYLLRVVRSAKLLVRQSTELRMLVVTIIKGFRTLMDFVILLMLFSFVCAVIGMQVFGGNPQFVNSRRNFDSFTQSFLTVFDMLTGVLSEVMWETMATTGPAAVFFIVSWVVVGKITLASPSSSQ